MHLTLYLADLSYASLTFIFGFFGQIATLNNVTDNTPPFFPPHQPYQDNLLILRDNFLRF